MSYVRAGPLRDWRPNFRAGHICLAMTTSFGTGLAACRGPHHRATTLPVGFKHTAGIDDSGRESVGPGAIKAFQKVA
jgi:hypothetical protein